MKSRSTFSVFFFIRKNKVKTNGLTNLLIRITIDGNSIEINSRMEVTPELWNVAAGRINGRSRSSILINSFIDKQRAFLNERFAFFMERDGKVCLDKLRDAFQGVEEDEHTLLKLIDKKIEEKRLLSGVSIDPSTVAKYERSRKKTADFIQSFCKKDDIPVSEVRYDFVKAYEVYLRSQCACAHNTTVKYMRYLKQVLTDAYKSRYIKIDPFYDYRLSVKKTTREILNREEIEILMNKDFKSQRLTEVRDFFVFCCFTGLAYTDAAHLKPESIFTETDSNGIERKYICINRIKTDEKSFIPLLKIPEMILEKYKGKVSGKMLPMPTNQKMNEYLKELTVVCGINKDLTSHCGRHTFATIMLTEGVSIETVAKMLGHADIRTTQIYAKILNDKVKSEVLSVADRFDGLRNKYGKTNQIATEVVSV